jgi:RNA polymerase sigma-70 factor (ECF subfamily)
MTHNTPDPQAELSANVQVSLNRFAAQLEPLRPELYRYCRHLTRSAWDAEDLAQDALARAFVTLGRMLEPPPNPRAWLFRVASNLWLDHVRRAREITGTPREASTNDDPRLAREAAGTLLSQLAPQERAAVVLKDVFEFSVEEIADTLSTTAGAIKAALHRGRGKLGALALESQPKALPSSRVLDAFCAAFNARDVDRLLALLLDAASVEVVGASESHGPGAARNGMLQGMLFGSRRMAEGDASTGIDPRLVRGMLAATPRAEVREHRGEHIVVLWYAHADGEAVRAAIRVDVEGDHIARLRNYFYTPECLAEVCAELQVPFRPNGYRHCLFA